MTDFEEYARQGEPPRRARGYAWRTAIGLQAVDGLVPSDYLVETARKHIDGDITAEEQAFARRHSARLDSAPHKLPHKLASRGQRQRGEAD